MGSNLLVYTVSCDNEFKQEPSALQSRWKTEKIWREFRQDILNAIHAKDEHKLQTILSRKNFLMTAYSSLVLDKKFDMVDLRGIELKNISFLDTDLSYCCFDFSQLNGIEFNQTHLQYSSFNNASIKKSKFIAAQCSPISSLNAKYEEVVFESGFFMHSDFRGSTFVKCNVTGADIPNSSPSLF